MICLRPNKSLKKSVHSAWWSEERKGFKARHVSAEILILAPLALCLWESHFTPLNLSFLINIMQCYKYLEVTFSIKKQSLGEM